MNILDCVYIAMKHENNPIRRQILRQKNVQIITANFLSRTT